MATKKVYLVDTENVGSTWKDLLPAKAGTDQILLFFTENSPYVSYLDLQLILQFPDRFEMIKCNPGKNGLDFQLVSYLGYLMKTASKANYVIVSNDGGFDAVVKFWQERGMSVSRMNVHRALQADAGQVARNAATPAKQETRGGGTSTAKKVVQGQKNEIKTASKETSKGAGNAAKNVSGSNPDKKTVATEASDETNGSKDSDTGAEKAAVQNPGEGNPYVDFNDGVEKATAGDSSEGELSRDLNAGAEMMAEQSSSEESLSRNLNAGAEVMADGNSNEESLPRNLNTGAKVMAEQDSNEGNLSRNLNAGTETVADQNSDEGNPFGDISTEADSSNLFTDRTMENPAAKAKNIAAGIVDDPKTETMADNTSNQATSTTDSDAAKNSGTAKKSSTTRRATPAKGTARTRARKSTVNAAVETLPENTPTAENTKTDGTASESSDATVKEIVDNSTVSPEPAESDTLSESAPKGKSTRAIKASRGKKAAAAEDVAPSAKTPAKRQPKTSAAPLVPSAEPATTDPENMELDFSSLTVSEKAALLRKYLPKEFSENPESFDIISDIMFGHDTTNHHQLHLAFVKNFGDEKGTLIYKAFRPHLAEFRA